MTDEISDRDILLVDNSPNRLLLRQRYLEAKGYSVASYTWKKLEALKDRHALFLQHLKLEARILVDRKNRLRTILQEFQPKSSYGREIDETLALFSLLQDYPATPRGALWAADVAYVCARNYGVLKLAERGVYAFSSKEISEKLHLTGLTRTDLTATLSALRKLKSLYRNGADVADLPIERHLQHLWKSFCEDRCVKPTPSPPEYVLHQAAALPHGSSAYHRLRNLEKIYLCMQSTDPSYPQYQLLARLERWIRDPRRYSGYAAINESALIEVIRDLSDQYRIRPAKSVAVTVQSAFTERFAML